MCVSICPINLCVCCIANQERKKELKKLQQRTLLLKNELIYFCSLAGPKWTSPRSSTLESALPLLLLFSNVNVHTIFAVILTFKGLLDSLRSHCRVLSHWSRVVPLQINMPSEQLSVKFEVVYKYRYVTKTCKRALDGLDAPIFISRITLHAPYH